MAKLATVQLPASLKERLVQGHPWVYRNHVPPNLHLPSGSWVRVQCGNWKGFGLWDNQSPIAIRLFSRQEPPTPKWLREQVQSAWNLRSILRQQGCTAYRWLFGEGDGLPGITVDLYGQFAVVQTYMESAEVLLNGLTDALQSTAPLEGIYLKTQHRLPQGGNSEALLAVNDREDQFENTAVDSKVKLIWGKPAPERLIVEEHGLKFRVDLHAGQKTGLFLDHRENRKFVEGLSKGRTVLNCFAYTGAFSLYALRGQASHVTSVDIGKGLAEAASTNVKLNGLDDRRHTFITQDCFTLLNDAIQQGKPFDLIILDPPSFAKTKQNRHAAQRAYSKLNALALRCLAPDGLLMSASCTSQVSPEAFKEAIAAAGATTGHQIQIIHEAGQAIDHPVPAQFPEGRYLKFVVGRVKPVS
jgi:23S rRNA (cytosine1962-C5)-methyltransferase